jgi:hypothetical protein
MKFWIIGDIILTKTVLVKMVQYNYHEKELTKSVTVKIEIKSLLMLNDTGTGKGVKSIFITQYGTHVLLHRRCFVMDVDHSLMFQKFSDYKWFCICTNIL